MTKAQAEWAAGHDWYVRTELDVDGEYVVFVRCDDGAGSYVDSWRNYQCLRAWAGY